MRRRWAAAGLAGACLACLVAGAAAPSPAFAQAGAAAQADRQALVDGLQAQFEVALIRERKMADDRETALIGALEARLRTARAQADAARGDARAANAALAGARADYAKLADQIAARDPETQADVAAYHAQAERQADQASPAKLAALQRFADGDRTGAWTALQSIVAAEDASGAATAASKAANARQLAELRDIMRAHGEATTADVLALYDRAADLDPANFRTQVARVTLAADLGDLSRAQAAAKQALAVAGDDNQRGLAIRLIGEQAVTQADYATAAADYNQALAIYQRTSAADPSAGNLRDALAKVLEDLGDLQVKLSDFSAARTNYGIALDIRRRLAAAAPTNATQQDEVTAVLQRIGDLEIKVGDLGAAKTAFQEGYDIRQKLSQADPTNTDLQYYASAFLRRLGDVAFQQRDLATARTDYETALAIRQKLSAANPSSGQLKGAVSLDYFDLGEVAFAQNRVADARAAYQQSLALRQQLAAVDPTNADLQQLILRTMVRLASVNDPNIGWSQVAEQYRAIKAAGHLSEGDQRVLEALQRRGLGAGL